MNIIKKAALIVSAAAATGIIAGSFLAPTSAAAPAPVATVSATTSLAPQPVITVTRQAAPAPTVTVTKVKTVTVIKTRVKIVHVGHRAPNGEELAELLQAAQAEPKGHCHLEWDGPAYPGYEAICNGK